MKVNPYLTFSGQCREAFEYYERLLGGKIEMMQTHGDSPIADNVPADWRDNVLHARLVAGDVVLMGCDAPPEHYAQPSGVHLTLAVDTPEDADRIFGALAEGGKVEMPIQQTFWAARFGMVVDRFGTPWMINCENPS